MMQPAATTPISFSCKVCGGTSPLFGVVDFHKSCIEQQGLRLEVSGQPVYYRRCKQCAFTFTNLFDPWTKEEFSRYIYNDSYITVDPDFVETRPVANAALVAQTFSASKSLIGILDYGGGSGVLAQKLRDQGFAAITYDPFSSFNQLPSSKFDLVTSFEVLEHVPFPRETVATMVSLLKQDGVILFSTLVQPADFEVIGLNWWYAGPRNGHVSLYSVASLARLFGAQGMRVGSFNANLHIAYTRVPAFAADLKFPS